MIKYSAMHGDAGWEDQRPARENYGKKKLKQQNNGTEVTGIKLLIVLENLQLINQN